MPATPVASRFSILHHNACASGQTEMVKFLIEENVPLTPLDGKTPLITACEEGQIELVTFMYQNPEKFDFSVRNEENLGPLEILSSQIL